MKNLTIVLLFCSSLAMISCSKYPSRSNRYIVVKEFVASKIPTQMVHASTIAECSDGSIVVAYYGGSVEGNNDCSIWISKKNGDTWSKPEMVADGVINGEKIACWNPVLFQIPNGELLLFYKVGSDIRSWEGYLIKSSDNGESWSTPERLPHGFLGPIKNKPVLIGNNLICGSSTEDDGWKVHFEFYNVSTNKWEMGPSIQTPEQIIQPTVILHHGQIMQMICRSKNAKGTIPTAFSSDLGRRWGKISYLPLLNNNSGIDAITLSKGGFLLVYNNAHGSIPPPRSPLNIDFSSDGIKWEPFLLLEHSIFEEFSYPAIIEGKDGIIHIVYTWKRKNIRYVEIDLDKVS
jgi:predicted neuraminidase